jgi:competence protein ComGC
MKTQTKSRLSRPGQPSGQTNAFTLVELLVVILTIAILTALLLPALASTGIKDQEIQCLTNVKQLQIAWTSYAGDNNGKLAQNIAGFVAGGGFATSGRQANAQPGQQYAGWVLGDVENADPNLITHGLIYQYVGNPAFYRCPMDTKTNTAGQPALRT